MTLSDERRSNYNNEYRELRLIISLLPPPISLDILCSITGQKAVSILQLAEELVASGYLCRCTEKGFGYYSLPNNEIARSTLAVICSNVLQTIVEKTIAAICSYLPDDTKRWLHIAHIYDISGLPVKHFKQVVKAGNYCCKLNLRHDASIYYEIALNSTDILNLNPIEQDFFVEAVIGLCSCRGDSLLPDIQRNLLEQALQFCLNTERWDKEVKLRILLAKTFQRTVRSDEATEHLEKAWRILEDHDLPQEMKLQLALANSELLFWQGFMSEAIEKYESVLGNFEEMPDEAETLKSCIRLGGTYGVAGETARGIGLVKSVRQKARELGNQELERYATLALVLLLGDAGRIEEGVDFLEEIFQTPIDLLDNYILWPAYGKKAYLAFCRGEYEKASVYQKLTCEQGKILGNPQHRGPDNIEVMLGLEERGIFNPDWHFDAEIKRLISWPDIYMKGIAFRFRALKLYRHEKSAVRIEADLNQSITLLERAGAKIELAHSQLLLARVKLEAGKSADAEKLLHSAWETFSKVNPDLFPEDLKPFLDQTDKHALWVDSLISVGNVLGSMQNREELLNQIIKHAMHIAGAERGAVLLRKNNQLEVVACRNIDLSEVESDTFSEQLKIIKNVFKTGEEVVTKAVVCSSVKDVHLHGSGWMACFPIIFKSEVMGAIYMDCELTRLQLPEDEIALLRIISNQAAIALSNLTIFEEIIDLNSSLMTDTNLYRKSQDSSPIITQMVGRSESFKQLLGLLGTVAQSDSTVLITGETGVGKDLVAQAIHQNSKRSSEPFIAVNVASLSHELIASELFGHEKGAFTGAITSRKGRFELASEGTLFLDDIDALSLDIQAKLLRVLETKEFERVGGTRTLRTEFRLLAASNIAIEDLVERGVFRADLYYRLNVFPIHIKPLRERPADIEVLVQYFLDIFSKKFGKKLEMISRKDLETLRNYHWPGNIRELRHVIERGVLLSTDERLVIPPLYEAQSKANHNAKEKFPTLKEMEAKHILNALAQCRGKVSGADGAAALLDVIPATLYSKMKRLGVKRDAYTLDSGKNNDKGSS